MELKFDIFMKLPDGKPLWVEAVEGFENAKLQLEKLVETTPGDYFIFNSRTGEIVAN